jgi:hypothetical protein
MEILKKILLPIAELSTILWFAVSVLASDLTITTGAQITPNKTADNGAYKQQSRLGPSVGVEFRKWFSAHHGLEAEGNFGNTDTRLANFTLNNWTMNRLSLDGAYVYRFSARKVSPFIKAGVGVMVTISGHAPNNVLVGLDDRMEEIAGVGINYHIGRKLSLSAEYECRFVLNSNFSDNAWKPRRNEVSEPKIGLTYTFGLGKHTTLIASSKR